MSDGLEDARLSLLPSLDVSQSCPVPIKSGSVLPSKADTDNHSNFISASSKLPPSVDQHTAVLYEQGYIQTRVISKTSQGQIIEVIAINNPSQKFVIKEVDKKLYWKNIGKHPTKDDCHISVAKDCIKEALLLHHVTVANTPPAEYICKYLKFFQDAQNFYLVMEHGGDITLRRWVELAFEHIDNKRLDLAVYKKMIKFIFFQTSVTLHWLHQDMSMAFLGDLFDHILIQNGEFVADPKTGKIMMNKDLTIKLCDFSLAEVFKPGKGTLCQKYCGIGHSKFSAPKVYAKRKYDACKADVWSLGMLLFRLAFNKYPYEAMTTDAGFWSIVSNQLGRFIRLNQLTQFTNVPMLSLMRHILCYEEDKRLDTKNILKSEWMDSYWSKYKDRILRKSFNQRTRLQSDVQQKHMSNFPYYRA